jgi:hypothetical protein
VKPFCLECAAAPLVLVCRKDAARAAHRPLRDWLLAQIEADPAMQ